MPAPTNAPSYRLLLLAALLLATTAPRAHGQADWPWRGRNVHVVVPQRRVFAPANNAPVQITAVNVGVVVLEQIATTTMDVILRNPTGRPQEAVMLLPVPDKATVRAFDFQGSAAEPQAKLLRREEARRIYDSIVSSSRDPALLEFVGYNLIQSSVFPVPANGEQKVRLTYEHILTVDGQRVDYVLPRTESLGYHVPWSINMRITSKRPIATVYSPSHMIETTRPAGRHQDRVVSVRLSKQSAGNPGSFRVSYLVESKDVAASIMAYPDPVNNGGYFLMLVGLPPRPEADPGTPSIKREVTLVLDRSGSMNGPKLQQVKEAALQVIEGLDDGEAFNVVIYNEVVETFAPQPVIKDDRTTEAARRFVRSIKPRGGTNIHDALLEALRPKPTPGLLPIVLFLTDGLPTIGQTNELAIRRVATKANRHGRRIFTFGVGVDVNTPLLENVAYETRAVSTFVMPEEDVEVKVASVFKRLSGPILADTELRVVEADGSAALGRVHGVLPHRLPDLFDGDQLVLMGKYVGEQPVHLRIRGNYLGKARSFKFTFSPEKATTKNAFVPRLWASRKIGVLIDAIRAQGATPGEVNANTLTSNPRLKELIDEIVSLSTEFGILTEYTAFLAREGTDLSRKDRVLAQAGKNFWDRAVQSRTGYGSLNQTLNLAHQKSQAWANPRNDYLDDKLNRVSMTAVQQVNDRAFYRRGNQWVDSRVVDKLGTIKATQVIEFGSPQFLQLVRRLAGEDRQGCIALGGDVLMVIDGKPTLIKAPAPTESATQP